MVKKILFSLIALSTMQTFCMDQEQKGAKATEDLPINLTNVPTIAIGNSFHKHIADVGITSHKTTIGDVKILLQQDGWGPVDQQSLRAKTPYLFGFLQTISKSLSNETPVTQAMREHQTNQFMLYLTLRQPNVSASPKTEAKK